MDIVTALKMGFALGVPASREVLQRIRDGVLVHRTRLANLDRIVTGVMKRADGIANARIKLTGDVGLDPLGLLRATLRDHRVVDFGIFSGAADRGMTDFVYFFLGEPDEAQMSAQSYGGSGEFATIRVRGADVLADPRRSIFYRRGLFWEADRAVIVKGGYEGPAQVELPVTLKAPLC
jgi:hypothetical protein